jgi:hypothetical protein
MIAAVARAGCASAGFPGVSPQAILASPLRGWGRWGRGRRWSPGSRHRGPGAPNAVIRTCCPRPGPPAGPSGRRDTTISRSITMRSGWRNCAICIAIRGPPAHELCAVGWKPVVRGLVARPEDWQWSSYRHYATGLRGTVEIESEWTAALRGAKLPEHLRFKEKKQ